MLTSRCNQQQGGISLRCMMPCYCGILFIIVAKKKSVSTRTRSKLSAAVMDRLRYFHQQVLLTTSLEGQHIRVYFQWIFNDLIIDLMLLVV